MTFKRKTELRFVQMELEQLRLLRMINKLMENQVNAAKRDVDTLELVEGLANLYESKNKTTKKSR